MHRASSEIQLSPYGAASTEPAPVSRMMAAFAEDFRGGVDVNLGVGYVNERTIPRQWIQKALSHVIEHSNRFSAPFNYGGPAGAPYLIDAIRRFYAQQQVGGLTAEVLQAKQVIVGVSGATSLLEALAAVLRRGIVITSDPNYYIFSNMLERFDYEIVTVGEDDAGINTDDLEQMLAQMKDRREQISFVYVVTVNNPTCSVLSNARRRRLVQIVSRLSTQLGRKVPLIMDTAYELLAHDPQLEKGASALTYDEHGIVYEIGTLSKILAPALRIGFLIGNASPMTGAIVQRISDVGFSAPLANQAMASYLLDHFAAEQLNIVRRGYRSKALLMRRAIEQHLGPHVEQCRGGQAGFYYYLTLKQIETHERSPFFRFLARTTGDRKIDGPPTQKHPRVIYIPGEHCVHRSGPLVEVAKRQLRLSYGFEEPEAIERAIRLMGQAAGEAGRAVSSEQ